MTKFKTLLMHYAIPSENLPNLATVGIAKIAIFGFRCGECQTDFHIDRKPKRKAHYAHVRRELCTQP